VSARGRWPLRRAPAELEARYVEAGWWTDETLAFFRMRPGADPPSLDGVTAHLAKAGLARQKWPEELRLVDDLPRTAAGKIRKIDLRTRLRTEAAR